MKTINFFRSLFIFSAIFLSSCNDESESLDENVSLIEDRSMNENEIEFVAKNYYTKNNQSTIERIVKSYRSFDYEAMKKFIDLRYQFSIEEGLPIEQAEKAKVLMHQINDQVFRFNGKSYATANQDLVADIYSGLVMNDNDEKSSKAANCADGIWFRTGTTDWDSNQTGPMASITFNGRVNLKGTSDDCDLLFRSQNFNSFFTVSRLSAQTGAAANALGFGGSTRSSSREDILNSQEAVFEFIIGSARVRLNYLFGGPNAFANDVLLSLSPR